MILVELFSQPYKYEEQKAVDDAYEARFTAGERDVLVNFEKIPRDGSHWEMAFGEIKHGSRSMSLLVTGSGDEFKVFSTVIDITKHFLDKYDPDSLSFTAEKSEGSRAKLYDKMVKRLVGGKYQTDVDHKGSDYRSYFTIVKSNKRAKP